MTERYKADEAYRVMIDVMIRDQSVNGPEEEFVDEAIDAVAAYYEYNGYTHDDLQENVELYHQYDLIKWTRG